MSFRFRHSLQLFPGVRINLSKGGASVSLGVPGATVNLGRHGVRGTAGLPGTGLSWSAFSPFEKAGAPRGGGGRRGDTGFDGGVRLQPQEAGAVHLAPDRRPSRMSAADWHRSGGPVLPVASAPLAELGSASLAGLAALLREAADQRAEVDRALAVLEREGMALKRRIDRRRRSWLRALLRRGTLRLEARLDAATAEWDALQDWRAASHIEVSFDGGAAEQAAWQRLDAAFAALAASGAIWDVVASRQADQRRERTMAQQGLTTQRTTLGPDAAPLLAFGGAALRFGNANGATLWLIPGLLVAREDGGAFALIDIRDVAVRGESVAMIGLDDPPADAVLVGETWEYANRDGSRDRRFAGNRKLLIHALGRIEMSAAGGLNEAWQVSRLQAALDFVAAFDAYKRTLPPAG